MCSICSKFGLTNGTNGSFRKLIYKKQSYNNDYNKTLNSIFNDINTVFIKKPLCAIVDIPTCNINGIFDGLKYKSIPIPLTKGHFKISSKNILSKSIHNILKRQQNFNVTRIQFAFVPAYAITTYKAQGQTLKKVIVDLVFPPFIKRKEEAKSYVPLSRIKCLNDLLILRDFNFNSINIKPSFYQKQQLIQFE